MFKLAFFKKKLTNFNLISQPITLWRHIRTYPFLVLFKLCVNIQQYTYDLTMWSRSSHHSNLDPYYFVHPFQYLPNSCPRLPTSALISSAQVKVHLKLHCKGSVMTGRRRTTFSPPPSQIYPHGGLTASNSGQQNY